MKGNWGPHPYAWAGKIPTEIPEWLARCAPDGRIKSAEMSKLLGVSENTFQTRLQRGDGPEIPAYEIYKTNDGRTRRAWIVRDVRNWIRENARKAKAVESAKA